jgi:hypothetical protein
VHAQKKNSFFYHSGSLELFEAFPHMQLSINLNSHDTPHSSGATELPRKDIVKVVLSRQQREILDVICRKLGQSESETLRVAFMEYARSLSLVTEKVHGKPTATSLTVTSP